MLLDSAAIDVPCPQCGKKHKKTVGWLKTNKRIACGCGGNVTVDPSRFRREIAKAERDLANFSRNITIKL